MSSPFSLSLSLSLSVTGTAVNERIDVLVPHGHVHAYVDGLAVTIDLKAKLQTPVAGGPSRRIRMAPSEVTARQTYDKLTGGETKWAA